MCQSHLPPPILLTAYNRLHTAHLHSLPHHHFPCCPEPVLFLGTTALHCTALHFTATALHCTALHLHCTATALQCTISLHCALLSRTTLDCITIFTGAWSLHSCNHSHNNGQEFPHPRWRVGLTHHKGAF